MKYEVLGYAGLLPFLGATAAILFGLSPAIAASALLFYAVAILSFLGGVQWGAALGADAPQMRRMVFAVIPSIAAWLAFAMPLRTSLIYLAACFAIFWAIERMNFRLSERYQRLRNILTGAVVFCLILSAVSL